MTEEKIKEIIQKMIDNNEPPEKIREFVKLAKAKMPKEDQTQEDATVKEEGTASTSETTSLDSLQLSPEAYSIVNSYRTADELKADIDAGKITNPEIINYVKGAGGEGPTDQELLVTSADEILKAQEVTEGDQAGILEKRNEVNEYLKKVAIALNMPDATAPEIEDALKRFMERDDIMTSGEPYGFSAEKVAKHNELRLRLVEAGVLKDIPEGFGSQYSKQYESNIADGNMQDLSSRQFKQTEALRAYIKAKMPNALDGLTPKESKDKKAQILNSEEFKEFEKEFTLDQEQLTKQEEYVAQDFLNQKEAILLEDRIQTQLQKNEKSGLLYDVGEVLSESVVANLPPYLQVLAKQELVELGLDRSFKRDVKESVALKELEGLNKRLKENILR